MNPPVVKQLAIIVLNRLVLLTALWFALNAFARSGCHAGPPWTGGLEDTLSNLKEIARALK